MNRNIPKYLKTADYAKMIGCTQRTVHRNFHLGRINGYQDPLTRAIYIENPEYSHADINRKRKEPSSMPVSLQQIIENRWMDRSRE